jgi:CheY-like chemotaxis protein
MDNYNAPHYNPEFYKILIVDDNPVNRMMVGRLLKNWGIKYKEAGSAEEAFEMISDKSYSLILMDINMPDVNGLEACAFIRKLSHTYFKELPIIALSANRVEDVKKQLLECGVTDYLSKPFSPNVLRGKIEALHNYC